MVAGNNIRVNIWRLNYQADNSVGGAVTTGTVLHTDVLAFFQGQPPEQLVLQQGLETTRTFRMTIIPGYLDIRERDEVQVIHPIDHVYFGDRFRVMGVRYSSHNKRDPRNYSILELVRSVEAHARQ